MQQQRRAVEETNVQQLQQQGIQLIDCQVYTAHLHSLGAVMIPRQQFIQQVAQWVSA